MYVTEVGGGVHVRETEWEREGALKQVCSSTTKLGGWRNEFSVDGELYTLMMVAHMPGRCFHFNGFCHKKLQHNQEGLYQDVLLRFGDPHLFTLFLSLLFKAQDLELRQI